jgi:formylglycine-generating enzyme required for sulfatase activity
MAEGLSPAYSINGKTNPDRWGKVPAGWDENSPWNAVEIVSGSTGYRLPTEAQWEYAARGGNGPPEDYTYAGSDDEDSVAWHYGNSSDGTKPVGAKMPNGLGLYDMSGNVWEWCWDWYETYPGEAQIDPVGASSGSSRVFRGGCWNFSVQGLRSAIRLYVSPNYREYSLGFRIVRP